MRDLAISTATSLVLALALALDLIVRLLSLTRALVERVSTLTVMACAWLARLHTDQWRERRLAEREERVRGQL